MVVETIDDSKSCWIAGVDTTLVGMPKAKSYNDSLATGFGHRWIISRSRAIDEDAAPGIRAARTYLAFDFRPGYADAGTYPAGVGRTPDYGPSSGHPGIVNHLFCDGSVREHAEKMWIMQRTFLRLREKCDPDMNPPEHEEAQQAIA